jgi:hypothetical protein
MTCCSERTRTLLVYFVGVVGTFLIIGALSWLVVRTPVDPLDAERAELRRRARQELGVQATRELAQFAIDPNKADLARLSIDRAIDVMVSEWKDGSEVGRAQLLERLEGSKELMSFE